MNLSIITSLAIWATSFCVVSALGINCRGSFLCIEAKHANANHKPIIPTLQDVVANSLKDDSTVYNSGEHVICDASKVCLFPQGASLTLGEIRPLIKAIYDHGCRVCGSVPVDFVSQGSNDPKPGILTFNHVENTRCDGDCIQWDPHPKPLPPPPSSTPPPPRPAPTTSLRNIPAPPIHGNIP